MRGLALLGKDVARHRGRASSLVVGIESGGRKKEVIVESTVAAFDILQTSNFSAVHFEPWSFALEVRADVKFSREDVVSVGSTLRPIRKGNS